MQSNMDKGNSQYWLSIYNVLFILGINTKELRSFETDVFDHLDELETVIDLGFCTDSFPNLRSFATSTPIHYESH